MLRKKQHMFFSFHLLYNLIYTMIRKMHKYTDNLVMETWPISENIKYKFKVI